MIKKCTLKDIESISGYRNRIRDIEEFIQSGADCCEYVLREREKPETAQCGFCAAIARRKYYSELVRCITRNGRVFLVRHENKRTDGENNA